MPPYLVQDVSDHLCMTCSGGSPLIGSETCRLSPTFGPEKRQREEAYRVRISLKRTVFEQSAVFFSLSSQGTVKSGDLP